ncbi:hypothetical protein AAGF08_02625 [Algoriphagus sp. SE2]|uniref:hypothetical protein n=1 Tax=Algoriphagus sp. SE2 TaxID=3141536 RepID=UPI0031CD7D0A
MSANPLRRDPFFFLFHILMLTIVVLGFAINAIFNTENLPPISTLIIVHSAFMISWFLLVIIQSGLIRGNKVAVHKKIGKLSIVLAIGIVVSGIILSFSSYARRGLAPNVMVNLINIVSFTILYALALYYYKYPTKHKRLITFASLALILPALLRLVTALNFSPLLSILFLIILIVMLVIHDKKTLKKVSRATMIGMVVVFIGIGLIAGFGQSESWASFLANTLGNG